MTKTKDKKIEFTLERSQEVAEKITRITEVVEELSDEDIDYLVATSEKLDDEMSTLQAVGGILVDLDKAAAKGKSAEQAQDRIRGIVLMWSAIKKVSEIQEEYIKKARARANLDSLFGL